MDPVNGVPQNGSKARTPTARLLRGLGGASGELEIEYDGLEPPMELFADLAAAGWTAPVPLPPPSDAIDWSRPDPLTGKRYSVLPYRATARSRPAGRLALAVDQIERLVETHCRPRVLHDIEAPPPLTSTIGDVPLSVSFVTVTLPPERVDALTSAHPTVEVLRSTPTTRTAIGRYRGREVEMTLPAVTLELRADAVVLRSLLQALHDVDDVEVRPQR